MTISTDVTVLGLGPMGAALANALLKKGFKVTVWNRTAGRDSALVEKGAQSAQEASDAVAASPVIVACLLNFSTTESVLASLDSERALSGKTIINTATGTPAEAVSFRAFCEHRSASYVDVKLMFYPRQVGAPDSVIYVAADQGVYDSSLPFLRALAGNIDYLGDNVESPAALYLAIWVYYYGGFFGFIESSAFLQRSGVNIDKFLDHVKRFNSDLLDHMDELANRVITGNYAGDQARLETYVDGFAKMDQAFVDKGIKAQLLQSIRALTDRAIANGLGAEDIAAVLKDISDTSAMRD